MICENCGIRPASVQVFQQQGDRRVTSYLCTQCARQLGMIGGRAGWDDPFAMLQNLVQQQQGGQGSFFEALSGEAQQAVMRAREVSAGTTRTAAIGTDHLLAGIVTGDNVATEALRRAGADVDGMRSHFHEFLGDPGEQVYTFTPSSKRALQLAFAAARQMGAAQVGSEHSASRAARRGRRQRVPGSCSSNGAGDAEALRREILRLLQQRGVRWGRACAWRARRRARPAVGRFRRWWTARRRRWLRWSGRGSRAAEPDADPGQVTRDLTRGGARRRARPGDGTRRGDSARRPHPLPPHQEQPRAHRRARRRQDGHRRGARPEDGLRGRPRDRSRASACSRSTRVALVAGTRFRGDFEERMQQMIEELQTRRRTSSCSSTSCTPSSGPAGPRARSTPRACSSPRSRAASCRSSARPRSTSTASTSRRTRRSSGASSPCSWTSRRWTRPWRYSSVSGTATRRTTGSRSPTRRSSPPPSSATATSPTASCRTRR